MKCVNAMPDDIVVFGNYIIARQGESESDLRISMKHDISMCYKHVDDEGPRGYKIAPT